MAPGEANVPSYDSEICDRDAFTSLYQMEPHTGDRYIFCTSRIIGMLCLLFAILKFGLCATSYSVLAAPGYAGIDSLVALVFLRAGSKRYRIVLTAATKCRKQCVQNDNSRPQFPSLPPSISTKSRRSSSALVTIGNQKRFDAAELAAAFEFF
jgi:hypothetical protein